MTNPILPIPILPITQPTDRLPVGKTCADCRYFVPKCSWLIGSLTGDETLCDWDPSRFRPKGE